MKYACYLMLHTTSIWVVLPPTTTTGLGATHSTWSLLRSGLEPVSRYVPAVNVSENGAVAVVVARRRVPEALVAMTVPGI